jgi:hypothetical protein
MIEEAMIVKLAAKWYAQQQAFPPHQGGQIAAAAVRACARELLREVGVPTALLEVEHGQA